MPTDTERREVAQRLRELPDDSTYPDLIGAIADHDGWYSAADAADRLADLIEPDSTIPTDPGEAALASVEGFIREMRHSTEEEQNEYSAMLKKMSVEMHPVDRDALLALAKEINDTSCDNNGELSVSLGDIWGWAQAIREALGVER